jgi:hypothetical protein
MAQDAWGRTPRFGCDFEYHAPRRGRVHATQLHFEQSGMGDRYSEVSMLLFVLIPWILFSIFTSSPLPMDNMLNRWF